MFPNEQMAVLWLSGGLRPTVVVKNLFDCS